MYASRIQGSTENGGRGVRVSVGLVPCISCQPILTNQLFVRKDHYLKFRSSLGSRVEQFRVHP